MQRLEVSCAGRRLYKSLGIKGAIGWSETLTPMCSTSVYTVSCSNSSHVSITDLFQ